jgi:hypothetical protein
MNHLKISPCYLIFIDILSIDKILEPMNAFYLHNRVVSGDNIIEK